MFPRHKEIRILMLLAGPAMLINVNRRYDRTDRGPSFDRLKQDTVTDAFMKNFKNLYVMYVFYFFFILIDKFKDIRVYIRTILFLLKY